jgi:hypothetical protein
MTKGLTKLPVTVTVIWAIGHWSLSIGHFPMTPHEIKPKQLRALLLLLVLLPLIPTVLMVRFVLDLVQIEHSAALERLRGIHQQTVLKAENAYARQLGGRVGTDG